MIAEMEVTIPLRESSNTMESDFLNSQGKQKLVQVIGEFEKLRVLKLQCLTQRSFFRETTLIWFEFIRRFEKLRVL